LVVFEGLIVIDTLWTGKVINYLGGRAILDDVFLCLEVKVLSGLLLLDLKLSRPHVSLDLVEERSFEFVNLSLIGGRFISFILVLTRGS